MSLRERADSAIRLLQPAAAYNYCMSDVRTISVPLSEREIKLAVLDYLGRKNALQDGVVINELPVANWSRRADLAVANGKLQAFEIKSDLDSLRRLDAQIALFSTRFDKVVVVTTARFLTPALERLPAYVEIWEAARKDDDVELRVARRGATREIKNKRILASYLQKSELVSFVRSSGAEVTQGASRDKLESLVDAMPLNRLRAYVLERLKQRYRREQDSPLLTRAERAGIISAATGKVAHSLRKVPSNKKVERGVRFDAFERKHGPLPEEMPSSVIARRKT
ncbi:sce7726 family protein [Stenotrophomonas acidaminiphila]